MHCTENIQHVKIYHNISGTIIINTNSRFSKDKRVLGYISLQNYYKIKNLTFLMSSLEEPKQKNLVEDTKISLVLIRFAGNKKFNTIKHICFKHIEYYRYILN